MADGRAGSGSYWYPDFVELLEVLDELLLRDETKLDECLTEKKILFLLAKEKFLTLPIGQIAVFDRDFAEFFECLFLDDQGLLDVVEAQPSLFQCEFANFEIIPLLEHARPEDILEGDETLSAKVLSEKKVSDRHWLKSPLKSFLRSPAFRREGQHFLNAGEMV
jgi:hypothetical protein